VLKLQFRLVRKQRFQLQGQHHVACNFQLPGCECLNKHQQHRCKYDSIPR